MIPISSLRAQLNFVEQDEGDDHELEALAQAYREDPRPGLLDGLDNDARQMIELSRAVTQYVENFTGIEDLVEEFPGGIPGDLQQAMLMLAAHFYEQREATIAGVSLQQVQPGAFEILARYRNYEF